MAMIFLGLVDRVTICPLVEVVTQCGAQKLEFQGPLGTAERGGALGLRTALISEILQPHHAKTLRRLQFP
jgi:hypothetical protein